MSTLTVEEAIQRYPRLADKEVTIIEVPPRDRAEWSPKAWLNEYEGVLQNTVKAHRLGSMVRY